MTNTALSRGDCTIHTDMTMDLRKLLTDEQLKASPDLANTLQVISVTQTAHKITDSVVMN